MIKTVETLLTNMGGKISAEGEPKKAVAWYDTNKRLNTIAIHTINFVGRIWIYGSLKENPTNDTDWFPIKLTDDYYIEYYQEPDPIKVNRVGKYLNIYGSYTWLKAKMDRDYLTSINKPDRIIYPTRFTTTGINIFNDFTSPISSNVGYIPLENEVVYDLEQVDLRYVGNIEKIYLAY